MIGGRETPRLSVVQVLAQDALAGTELMVAALAERSEAEGLDTTVLTLDRPGPIAARLRAAGVPVASLGGSGSALALARLVRRLRALRPDVVCGYGFRVGVFTRVIGRLVLPGAAIVTGVRGFYVTELERIDGPRGRAVMAVERLTSPLVDAYVANSAGAANVLARHGVAAERLHVIPNGIDHEPWKAPDRAGRSGEPLVVCVGRFSAIKRQIDLVEAAALLRDRGVAARFVLAGDGPMLAEMRARVRELGLDGSIELPGRLEPDVVPTLLARADVACLVSSHEGMPGAVMEAMAAALPVVGTAVNGIADLVVDGKTGLLVPPGDPVALAAALERLVESPELRRALGAGGRRRIVEELTLDRMVATTGEVYRRLALPAPADPDVTVVVPVWDDYAGPVLAETLASILAQRPCPEVVVFDNASRTPVVAPAGVAVATADRRLTVGAARNAAMADVTTRWTMLWDADDLMLPGTLADLLKRAEADPSIVVVATGIVDGATGRRHHWPRRWTMPFARLPRLYALVHVVSSLYPTTGALLRTDVVLEGGGFADAEGGDDWVAGVSLALRGRVAFGRKLGRVYRRHPGSVSADWTGVDDITRHAALVRARLAADPAAPALARGAMPALRLAQTLVIRVLRPASRRLPGRRRELRSGPRLTER